MKRPWMPLYVADYLADTAPLMATESGAYLHLLMHYWFNGPLPDNDTRLCRIAKVHPPHWKRVRAALEPFFDLTKRPGLWSHHRADQEITKAEELSNKRKAAAQQKQSKSSANAEQLHTQSQLQLLSKKGSKEEDSPSGAAGNGLLPYAYENGIIRLNEKDLKRWQEAFTELNLRAELEALTHWAADQGKNWFHAVAGALAKKNREAKIQREAVKVGLEAGRKRPVTGGGWA